jgi:large subunit ribosomal protein L15
MGTTLHTLKPNKGAVRGKKRLGRGHGSGLHKTAGKGTKGQKARTGHHGIPKPGFEGGQTAMARRLPKRGFTNYPFKKSFFGVNVGDIAVRFAAYNGAIDPEALKAEGLVPRQAEWVKVLGDGAVERPIQILAHAFSASAKEKLEKAGGKVELLPLPVRKGPKAKQES